MELAGAVTLATDGVHDRGSKIGAETSRAMQSVKERPPPPTGACTFRSGRNSNLPVTHLLPITPPVDKSVYFSVPEAMSPTPMLPAPRPTATDSSSWPIDVVLVHTSDDEWRRSDCSCFRAVPSEHVAARRRALCARMRSLGMSVQTETTRDGHHVLLLLAAPESLLEEMAERVSLEKSLLNGGGFACFNRQRRAAFEASAEGWTSQGWGGAAAATGGAAVATGGAWASTVTSAFHASGIARRPSLFTSLERIRLMLALLECSKDEGGCALRLDEELTSGVLTAVVPIHDPFACEQLLQTWSHFSFWPSQPLDEVRDYLGGGIASYFAFVELLAKALLLPAVAGVLLTLHDALAIDRMDSGGPLHALFVLLLLLWTCAFAKLWRRREARLAFRWGHDDPSALEGGGAEASSAAVRAVVWAQAGEGSLSNSNGRLAIRSTQGTRRGFIGEARRGFYSTEGHFVDVEEADPHARIAPTNLKFTPEQRRWRVCLSWLLMLPLVLLSVGITTGLLTQRTLMLEASLYETHKVVILLPTLPTPTSFTSHVSSGSSPLSAPSLVSRSSLLAPSRRHPPPSTPPPRAPPLALAFPIAPEYGPRLAAAWGGSLVGVFIALTNPLYAAAARRLVEFENFRTENEHHAALMKTTLLFQALNSFAPVLWVACAKVPPVAQMAEAISQAAHAALGSGVVPSSAPPRLPYCHDLARFNQTASQLLAEGGGFNGHCLDELTVQLSALLVAYTVLTKLLEASLIRARTLLGAWAERRSAYGAHERLVEQQSAAIELARVEATERAAAATWAASQQQAAFETKASDDKEVDEREVAADAAVAVATPTASSFSSSPSAHESSSCLPPPATFPPPLSAHGANGTRATIGKGSAKAGGGGRKQAAGRASGGDAGGGSSHGDAPRFLSSRHQPRTLWGSTWLESVALFCLRWSRPKAREASKVALANARAAAALRELRPMNYYENQCRLEPHEGVFAEYSRVVVQLGFVVLFAQAVPLGALVCYLSLLFELRSDSHKLLAETQRPVAMNVRGGGMATGTWRHAPWILAVLGTVTNVILLGVALPQLREWLPLLMPFGATASIGATHGATGATETKAGDDSDVVVALYVCEHLLLLGMYGVHVLVPDVPKELSIDAARLRWKADLTIAVYSEKPPQPPSEWNDAAIPANFWEAAPRTAAAVLQQHLADRFTVPPRQSTATPKLPQGPMLGRGAML